MSEDQLKYIKKFGKIPFVKNVPYKRTWKGMSETIYFQDDRIFYFQDDRIYGNGVFYLYYCSTFPDSPSTTLISEIEIKHSTIVPLEFPYEFGKLYKLYTKTFLNSDLVKTIKFEDVGIGYIQITILDNPLEASTNPKKYTWEEYIHSMYSYGLEPYVDHIELCNEASKYLSSAVKGITSGSSLPTNVTYYPSISGTFKIPYDYQNTTVVRGFSVDSTKEEPKKEIKLEFNRLSKEAIEAESSKILDEDIGFYFDAANRKDFDKIKSKLALYRLSSNQEKANIVRSLGSYSQESFADRVRRYHEEVITYNKKQTSTEFFKDLINFTSKINFKRTINIFSPDVKVHINNLIKFFNDNKKYLQDVLKMNQVWIETFKAYNVDSHKEDIEFRVRELRMYSGEGFYLDIINSRISSLIVTLNVIRTYEASLDSKIESLERYYDIINEVVVNMIPSWFIKLAILEGKQLKDLDKGILESLNGERLEILGKVKEVT